MTASRTYLDYNATTPLLPAARDAMLAALKLTGNPSSVHAEGRQVRAIVENAREQVALMVNAKPSEIVFTSGAAEANATVMAGAWNVIAAGPIEHETVLAGLAQHVKVVELPVGIDGRVVLPLAGAWPNLPATGVNSYGGALLSLQLANNETGVIQPVEEAAALARQHGYAVHCDAVQGPGRIPVDFRAIGVDFLSLSAHKLGGPKGIGALVIRDGASLSPLIPGGQERRRRGGTENVAAIAGFGAAAEAVSGMLAAASRIAALRDRLEREIRSISPGVVVIGAESPRLPNTSCIALPGMRAETLVIRLDLKGIAVSAGAACSSGKVGSSHVLAAMGLSPAVARAAIRVSLGSGSTAADIDRFLATISEIVAAEKRCLTSGLTPA
jgi:cysteine desulfurase